MSHLNCSSIIRIVKACKTKRYSQGNVPERLCQYIYGQGIGGHLGIDHRGNGEVNAGNAVSSGIDIHGPPCIDLENSAKKVRNNGI